MISAVTNPFLYGYFNETFKNGLKKFFSFCYPQINIEIHEIPSDQSRFSLNTIQSNKYHLNDKQLNSKYDQSLTLFNESLLNSGSISPLSNQQ